MQLVSMDSIFSQLAQVPKPYQALAILVLTSVLLVIIGRWAVEWLVQRWRRRRHLRATNVVPMEKRRRKRPKATRPRRSGALNPLWLVLAAGALAVLFRSDLWFELRTPTILTGTVTHVRDGDTIEVNRRAIRLNGLTCDERGTTLGNQATTAMMSLVSGKTVTCELNGDRTYDREVGRCSLADGRDIGAVMIGQGLCGRCARYDPLRKYASTQQQAGRFEGAYPQYCWALW